MKYYSLVVLCVLAVTTNALPEDERINGENGWYVPQPDGSFEWVDSDDFDLNEVVDEFGNVRIIEGRFSTNPVTFFLYTRDNPEKEQIITASKKSIDGSNFNPANPTRIAIHGWRSGVKDYINYGVRNAYLGKDEYNFIFVDWGRARSIDYASSTYAVAGVGKKCAALVDFLVENYGLDLSTVEIIGHSLGAHVAGLTGKNIKSGQVHAIVGLDPALPLFNFDKPHQRLADTDAHYVETIQTNGGKLGFLKPIGKGAFYPNGGEKQPGCSTDLTGACSHSRAIEYYVEAIDIDNFISVKCENYEDAVAKKCGFTFSSIRMGAVGNAFIVDGEFFVPVNSATPFGKLE